MASVFAKPDKVLELAGHALADLALLMSLPRHVPTLHLAKTSFWSGTKINQIRFATYPDKGLIELARAEAARRAGTWDAWAFSCLAVSPTDQKKPVLLVEAGDAPVANIVRIIQEFRLPKDGFGLCGTPRFSLTVHGNVRPLDEAEASSWPEFLHEGISKLARDKWKRWSAQPSDQMPLAPA